MGSFRFYDPFEKNKELEYSHLGFSQQITWMYQYILLGIAISLMGFLHIRKYKKVKWWKSLQRYLLSDSHIWNGYFNSNLNLWIISSYIILNLLISIVNLPMDDSFNLAIRFGLVAISNIPLLYLLPLKASVFSFCLSYENLIIYHKAVGTVVLITSLIHTMAFIYCLSWSYLFSDMATLTGFYMISAFLLIGTTSIVLIRHYVYEFFYTVHILMSYSFLPLCYKHHTVCKPFVLLVTISLVIDKLVKLYKTYFTTCKIVSNNLNKNDLIIEISKPKNFNWNCSDHLYINIPKISIFQTHPFTISNLSNDDKILLIVKINKGFTKKLYLKSLVQNEFKCFFHGPYGISHTHIHIDDNLKNYTISQESNLEVDTTPSFLLNDKAYRSYGSIKTLNSEDNSSSQHVLIAAGSGITFILPILLKYIEYENKYKTKLNYKFIWILKNDLIIDLLPIKIQELFNSSKRISSSVLTLPIIENKKIKLWFTSKSARPDINELLFNSIEDFKKIKTLKIFACGPSFFINEVKKFGLDQLSNCEVDIILEQFSF